MFASGWLVEFKLALLADESNQATYTCTFISIFQKYESPHNPNEESDGDFTWLHGNSI